MARAEKPEINNEKGSALVYILIAIALLAALTMAFMNPSSNQTTSQNTFRTVSEVQTQVDFIRSALQECVLTYPGGDANVLTFTSSHNYPIMPDNTYFDNCVANPSQATHEVNALRCPGNPGDSAGLVAVASCHAPMFGGNTGKFMPPPPSLFGDWNYYSGDDGVFFWIGTSNSDAFLNTVLTKLDEGYSECEADFMMPTAGDFQMTSDLGADVVCPNNNKCFRVWIKIDDTNGVPTYFPGGEEATAGCP